MKDKKIDDIVAMLDQFVTEGGGHMNIKVDKEGDVKKEVRKSDPDCIPDIGIDMACQIPNLHEGLDAEEE